MCLSTKRHETFHADQIQSFLESGDRHVLIVTVDSNSTRIYSANASRFIYAFPRHISRMPAERKLTVTLSVFPL